jgi:tripartite-type tricarboxylate transporter receptor subunit TctC
MIQRTKSLVATIVAASLAASPMATAQDQAYPAKPVTIVVAYAAGGATDVAARAVAQRLAEIWARPVLIENRAGANTQIGATYVAKSAPDGYTILATADVTFVVNPYLYHRLSYDPIKDFMPITGLGVINEALVVHPSMPLHSVADLIALAKAKPGMLNYGSFGVGSAPQMSMELFQARAGVRLNAVQYKGGGPALTDVIAGHIPMMFVSVGAMAQPWKADQLRPLGVGSVKRLAQFPELPTIAESIPGFSAAFWMGLFAPSRTPGDVVAKINTDVQRVLADADFQEKFLAPNFYEPVTGSPEQFAAFIKADAARWSTVITDAKLTIEQ